MGSVARGCDHMVRDDVYPVMEKKGVDESRA
jgi:hypothetical protein